MLRWPDKDPDAELSYSLDWSAWLGSDTIATTQWIVPVGITKASDGLNAAKTVTTIMLSGGDAGSAYDLVNRITTTGGLTDDRTVRIRVIDR